MINELPKGYITVIAGPKGSGKSSLAKTLASRYGTYSVCSLKSLVSSFSEWASIQPGTIIVEGEFPRTAKDLSVVREITTNDEVVVNKKGKASYAVKSPRLVFCIEDASSVAAVCPKDFRRLNLINLPAKVV